MMTKECYRHSGSHITRRDLIVARERLYSKVLQTFHSFRSELYTDSSIHHQIITSSNVQFISINSNQLSRISQNVRQDRPAIRSVITTDSPSFTTSSLLIRYLVTGRAQPRFLSSGPSLLNTKDRASTVGVITPLRYDGTLRVASW